MKVEAYLNLSGSEAFKALKEAVQRRALVMLVARCSVEYEGRGASKLGEGDRVVLIKPDGAVLVHRPTGYSPVNWQPESKVIEVKLEGDRIVITCIRAKPREVLTIKASRIYSIVKVEGMVDTAEFVEYVDELELRDYIASHPEIIEPGLKVVEVEKEAGSGFADIYAVDSKGRIVVIEVKRVTANKDAVVQLLRYVEHFRKLSREAVVRGILVAPSITKPALELLRALNLEYKQVSLEKVYRGRKEVERGSGTLLDYLSGRERRARQ